MKKRYAIVHVAKIKPSDSGKSILLQGWVQEIRDIGKLKFIVLRDVSGVIQVTAHKETTPASVFSQISKIPKESVVVIEGKVKKSKQAPGGREVEPEKITLVSEAEQPLPIDISERSKTELPKRLDYRWLDLRRPSTATIFKIRSAFLKLATDWFSKEGFIQINSPKITVVGAEGGAEMFNLMYFSKPAFLAQSPQLYKQETQSAFEKVFEIGSCYRAEPHHTPRHLCEFTGLDFEISFIKDENDIMRVCEKMLHDIIKKLSDECKDELKLLKVKVKIPKIPFTKITHSEALKITKKKEFDPEAERKISDYVLKKYKSEFVWITNYPWEKKPFYTMKEKTGKFGRDFDLLFKGLEIVTGSQREHRYNTLLKQAKDKKMSATGFKSYFDYFRYGVPPHGGLGLGIDRFIKQLLNLENIREAVLFPRDPERLLP